MTDVSPPAPWDGRDWIARLRHRRVLFLHWRIPPPAAARLVPAELAVDTFDGSAWLTLGTSQVTNAGPRFLPARLAMPSYREAEARIPVRFHGRPGFWFLRLETTARLLAIIGRTALHLPYETGSVRIDGKPPESVHVRNGFFAARYTVAAEKGAVPAAGMLEAFLLERPRMFVRRRHAIWRGEEHNAQPWTVQPVDVEVDAVTLPGEWGLRVGSVPDAAGFVAAVDSRYSRLLTG